MSSLASRQSRPWPRRKPLWKQRGVLDGKFGRAVFPLRDFPLLARVPGIRDVLGLLLLLPTVGYVSGDSLEGHGVNVLLVPPFPPGQFPCAEEAESESLLRIGDGLGWEDLKSHPRAGTAPTGPEHLLSMFEPFYLVLPFGQENFRVSGAKEKFRL